jgi:hypothetical protein
MTNVVCHIPVTIRVAGELRTSHLDQLEAVVRAAVADRMTRARREISERLLVRAAAAERPFTTAAEGPAERFEPSLASAGETTYAVASYGDRGAKKAVPMRAASSDDVMPFASDFEGFTILKLTGPNYVEIGSERYAVSSNLFRATQWGLYLFGARSFIVLERLSGGGDPDERFITVATRPTLTRAEVGRLTPIEGMDTAFATEQFIWRSEYRDRTGAFYRIRGLITKEGELLTADGATYFEFQAELAKAPKGSGIAPRVARRAVFEDIDALVQRIIAGEADLIEDAARELVKLDAQAFSVVDWETKALYVEILLRAWTGAAEETAVVEIIKSLRTGSQLDAVLDLLAAAGRYEQLFNDLDDELWSLLVVIGERFGEPGPISIDFLADLLRDAGLIPRSLEDVAKRVVASGALGPGALLIPIDVIAEVEEGVRALGRFFVGLAQGIWLMLSHPDKVIEGVGQLMKMIVMVTLASQGYPPAIASVAKMVLQISKQVVFGLKGAVRVEATEQVMRRIRWAVIVEVASWFVGVGEVKAVLKGVGITEKAAVVAKTIAVLGKLGRFAEAEEIAVRLTRFAKAMREASSVLRGLRDEEAVLQVLSHLPEEDIARLAKAVRATEIEEGASLATLAGRASELSEVAPDVMHKTELLQELAAKAGGLSEELGEAFGRLASGHLPLRDVGEIVAAIPKGKGATFARAIRDVPGEILAADAKVVKALAADATRIESASRVGYGTFRSVFKQAEGDAAMIDRYVGALREMEGRYAQQGRAAEYQRFLDDLANGTADARGRLDFAAVSEAEIEAAFEGRTRPDVTGGKKPRIADRPVPTTKRDRLDMEHIARLEGETAQAAVDRVEKLIGRPISETPLKDAWEAARQKVLGGKPASSVTDKTEMIKTYNKVRDEFWEQARVRPEAKSYLEELGFGFEGGGNAPQLRVNTKLPTQEIRVSLDHSAEKAIGENWKRAIDADNLVFEFQNPNTFREVVQVRHGLRPALP